MPNEKILGLPSRLNGEESNFRLRRRSNCAQYHY